MELYFATSNAHKFAEAERILAALGIQVRRFDFKHNEIRSDSLEEIARDALAAAYARLRKPVFVEDSGLFIGALNGFPGTYSGWVFGKVGAQGILKLMAGVPARSRQARFESCIAYTDGREHGVFRGSCEGGISEGERGGSGFGYDPIFVPSGRAQTFAESIDLKNKLSHRYNSLSEFSEYIRRNDR